MKRTLNCQASDYQKMNANELKTAIKASEGRTICSENIVPLQAQIGVTNAEIARAFGADLILLNVFDVFNPHIAGLEIENPEKIIQRLKELVGRPVGINLEPIDLEAPMLESRLEIEEGRIASKKSILKAQELGFDFICLTGNPATGVSHQEIAKAIKLVEENFDGMIIAGKMHGSGADESVIPNEAMIQEYLDSGADVILLPAVGTVPGFTDQMLIDTVKLIHKHDCLVMTAIGTSQEGASKEVIENIAIRNKIAGADIQHIGDAGYGGIATVENIFAMSVAIRGIRHTIISMAKSVNR